MKKSILFVDDEPNVIMGLRRMLRSMRDKWDMYFAESGEEALEILRKNYLDVIVSDMRMPGMDGAELVNQVMNLYPQVVRIILSGHSDQEMILRSAGSTHQFITKPCNADQLIAVIESTCLKRDLLKNEKIMKIITGIKELPSLPDLYFKLVEEIKSEDPSLKKIGKIISSDITMTAKILHLVNSAFFGLPQTVSDIYQAVNFLGTNLIKSLVLSVHIFTTFKTKPRSEISVEELWEHSMRVGHLAQKLARSEMLDKKIIEDTFLSGVLHDLGKLLVLNIENYYKEIKNLVFEKDIKPFDAEYEIWGTSHAEIGAYLLGLWGIPDSIVSSIAYHHYPSRSPENKFSLLTSLHVSNAYVMHSDLFEKENNYRFVDFQHLREIKQEHKINEWFEQFDIIKNKGWKYD